MKVRINKLLSDTGLGSRREVEDYIRGGRVRLNGRKASLGDQVGVEDELLLDGVDLPTRELVQESLALDKLIAKENQKKDRPRPRDKKTERAESQRIASQPKSAALRKTSKNNPENKRLYRMRLEEVGIEDGEAVHSGQRTRGTRGLSRGRSNNKHSER